MMASASLIAVSSFLPEGVLTNQELAEQFDGWSAEKIRGKLGIEQRRIASADECASDLAWHAARRLFDTGLCRAEEIDFLLLCTQSPDYLLPSTSCLLQHRLGIPTSAGALDFTLGCSGFIYGLGLAKGLIATGQASRILLLTADTYSKFLEHDDRAVRTVFGDGAAAALITDSQTGLQIGNTAFGTDGAGAESLMMFGSGLRDGWPPQPRPLRMDGPAIFNFTLRVVPEIVDRVLRTAGLSLDDINLFVFHQANEFMLQHLRQALKIPSERFLVVLSDCGNTVSSTIPIALEAAWAQGRVRRGERVLLVGFGVGLSWGAALMQVTTEGNP